MGIAISTTLVARREQKYIDLLGRHVNPYSLKSQTTLEGLKQLFYMNGADMTTATQRSHALLFRMVARQSAMVAYNTTFWTLAIIFLAMWPFVFLMRKPTAKGPGISAH
jgi:MFS transporter, DHA2 family, multidrug resistance protein